MYEQGAASDIRLFLAAVPDAEAAQRIHRLAALLKRAHRLTGRLIRPERLHASLFSLGGLPECSLRAALAAAADLQVPPFEVSFDRTASFRGGPGGRPFVLLGDEGVKALKSFRRRLGAALAGQGLKRLARTNFEPHVTLLYDARGVEEYPVEPISWTVDAFVLIRSMNGHQHLARWPLAPPI